MLSIIIVNYNGVKFLTGCLNSIEEHVNRPHEVIVVDNASTDGSVELIKENFPRVRLIQSGKNSGFSGGNNIGARCAKGELMLLLNNDTRLLTPLDAAIEEFGRDERLGALGCGMSYGDGSFQPTIGLEATPLSLVLSWTGLARFRFAPEVFKRVEHDQRQYLAAKNGVAWISGAFLMTRRGLWDALGGFDERYFMYVEDVDYCRKVREAGYRVDYTPLVKIVHYEGGGKAWIGDKALTDSMRSYIVYMKKFHNRSVFFMRAGLGMVMAARMFAYGIASFFSGSQVYKEKKKGYSKAVRILTGIEDID